LDSGDYLPTEFATAYPHASFITPLTPSVKHVHNQGHTRGSISIVLESGEAFVGDTCFNVFSLVRSSVFPPFADNTELLYESWKILLDSNAKIFLPGHGRPFIREKLATSLEKRTSYEELNRRK
jgi:glyoxylase-like metal-dependent hydrolase (beta-lactamase superfamily II)